MQRIEINLSTGERKVVDLSSEEIDEANTRTLAAAPGEGVAAVNAAFEAAAARLTVSYPPSERLTWPIQEGEALAWNADNNALTPYIDALSGARGIPRELYLQKTLAKVQAFRAASALMVGTRQKALDKIAAAQDVAGINAARDAALQALKLMP